MNDIVGDYPKSNPALDSVRPFIERSTQPTPAFENTDAAFTAGAPLLKFRVLSVSLRRDSEDSRYLLPETILLALQSPCVASALPSGSLLRARRCQDQIARGSNI